MLSFRPLKNEGGLLLTIQAQFAILIENNNRARETSVKQ
nr:MAG TPA: hypothetical protein [Caudoviricetes sp.]